MRSSPETTLRRRDLVASGLCIGCGACVAATPDNSGAIAFDRFGQYAPAGPREWLDRPDPVLARVCPFSPHARNEDEIAAERFPLASRRDARTGRFEAAFVGAAIEGDFRARGSSGGLVSWVAGELLDRGLVDGVAHVAPAGESHPYFAYRISRSSEAVRAGAKSRYYPVELSGIVAEIRRVPGRYAIVGIPCFIKAIRLLCEADAVLAERIAYTLGLFCGHMKSARFVESFAWQLGVAPEAVTRPEFRLKDPNRPANWYTAHLTLSDGSTRQKDWWHLCDGDWGAGFFQNAACNSCDDVMAETADIAFGDAWVEPYASDGRGTNVVIARTPELAGHLRRAGDAGRLELAEVDADFLAATQAAGLRQRREGLAYRLTWRRKGLRPNKRVAPSADLPLRRKAIYRLRHHISAASHRVFLLARRLGLPGLYIGWARCALAVYQGVAYGRGFAGRLAKRIGLAAPDG